MSPGDDDWLQKFTEAARPSPKTVQKVARGEHEKPARRRKRRGPAKKVAEVQSLRVDPRVWEVALGLASSPSHIEIRSEEEVVVHNHPPPWP